MLDELQSVYDLPDVSFIDFDSLGGMMQRLITNYEEKYTEATGVPRSLAPADPIRIVLYAVALELYQIEQYVDRAGKQDLLKYSYGTFLDNLAGGRCVFRRQPTPATTTIRFTLSKMMDYAVGIPVGTRVSNGDSVYFITTEYGEVPIGAAFVDIRAECTEKGIVGNDLLPGQVKNLVDPIPYVQSVSNVTTTGNGSDLESDESLAERTFLAPSRFSVAGPADAYIFWAKTYNPDIGSVKVRNPEPREVDIIFLMRDGSFPDDETISGLEKYLMEQPVRPLTDVVSAKRPKAVNFEINLTYYIRRSDAARAVTIQSEVDKAVQDYVAWQTSEIGRDIVPSELVARLKQAGIKRPVIAEPAFTVVTDTEVGRCADIHVNYGGLEND